MSVHLIPGAVGPTSIRALLLTASDGEPVVTIDPPDSTPVVTRVTLNAPFEIALRPLRLWQIAASPLQPVTSYRLQANVQGSASNAVAFRTLDPAAHSLKFVAASCFYDGFHAGGDYHSALAGPYCNEARFKILLGDNVYVDVHPTQASFIDGFVETAFIYKKYFWLDAGYRDALSMLPTFTTWDDHEVWNNAPETQLHLKRTRDAMRDQYLAAALSGIDAFQVPLNPIPPIKNSRSYRIDSLPLVDLFVLDARSQRSILKTAEPKLVPTDALTALQLWARKLERPGILVIGQPLVCETGSKWVDYWPADFAAQFEAIWQSIHDAKWDIMILTGDVHHSRVSRFTFGDGRQVFELVTSPASHIPTVFSELTGSYGSQGKSDVEFVEKPKAGFLRPELRDYYFGTDAENSIAVIELTAKGNRHVQVGCTFLDLRTGEPAEATRANRRWFGGGRKPLYPNCTAGSLFTLQERNP
jgi:phosphodiesterase/alkaline phosphatase D-like protein